MKGEKMLKRKNFLVVLGVSICFSLGSSQFINTGTLFKDNGLNAITEKADESLIFENPGDYAEFNEGKATAPKAALFEATVEDFVNLKKVTFDQGTTYAPEPGTEIVDGHEFIFSGDLGITSPKYEEVLGGKVLQLRASKKNILVGQDDITASSGKMIYYSTKDSVSAPDFIINGIKATVLSNVMSDDGTTTKADGSGEKRYRYEATYSFGSALTGRFTLSNTANAKYVVSFTLSEEGLDRPINLLSTYRIPLHGGYKLNNTADGASYEILEGKEYIEIDEVNGIIYGLDQGKAKVRVYNSINEDTINVRVGQAKNNMSIRSFKTSKSAELAYIKGYVTQTEKDGFYLSDPSGSIYIADADTAVKVGETLNVSGTYKEGDVPAVTPTAVGVATIAVNRISPAFTKIEPQKPRVIDSITQFNALTVADSGDRFIFTGKYNAGENRLDFADGTAIPNVKMSETFTDYYEGGDFFAITINVGWNGTQVVLPEVVEGAELINNSFDGVIKDVKIDADTSVILEDGLDLNAKCLPLIGDQTMTYTTSDAGVASVDATGKVTIKKVGSVTITATSVNNPEKKASKTFTIALHTTDTLKTVYETGTSTSKYYYTQGEVIATAKNGFTIRDNTGTMFVYTKDTPPNYLTIGTQYRVKGVKDLHKNLAQLANPEVFTVLDESYDVGSGTDAEFMNALQFDNFSLTASTVGKRVKLIVKGVGNHANFTIDGAIKKGEAYYLLDSLGDNGKFLKDVYYEIDGYILGVNNDSYYIMTNNVKRAQFVAPTSISITSNSGTFATTNKLPIQLGVDFVGTEPMIKDIVWTHNSGELVKSIDENGLLTPNAGQAGEVTVTATVKGTEVKATQVVTIAQPVTPESIAVATDDGNSTVIIGVDKQLVITSPTANADIEATYASSSEAVATVTNEGVVTGLTEGEVTITATSVADGSKSATITLNVKIGRLAKSGFSFSSTGTGDLSTTPDKINEVAVKDESLNYDIIFTGGRKVMLGNAKAPTIKNALKLGNSKAEGKGQLTFKLSDDQVGKKVKIKCSGWAETDQIKLNGGDFKTIGAIKENTAVVEFVLDVAANEFVIDFTQRGFVYEIEVFA